MNTGETQFEIDDEYITHTLSGTSGSDTKTWTFNWTPGSSTGDVTFYVAVNASNHDDDADGDNIFLSSVTFSENPENTPLQIGENDPQISFTMNNPVKDILFLTMSDTNNEPATADIINLNGSVVRSLYLTGDKNFTIPVEDLSAGTYLVRINQGNVFHAEKFIKF
ncbi:MAG: T9SS type A sorting domain-containing protein [Fimbriimonadaceae bacterium]|nr:T9SS type A sorting domain-containing protein [Chitinophagales bacterium]